MADNNSSYFAPRTSQHEFQYTDINYNCTECQSLIEILSIDEEKKEIEFKCTNKDNNHGIKIMTIAEYLKKMKNKNQNNINSDECKEHNNNKYVSFCLDCNHHLCEECLKSRVHINHRKNNTIEVKPIPNELLIFGKIIKEYHQKIKNLNCQKIKKKKELDNIIQNKKNIEEKRKDDKIKMNNEEEKKELDDEKEKYISDIEKIKKNYENEIKQRKDKYEKDKKEIKNKYKLQNIKENMIYEFNIKEIVKKYNEVFNNLQYDLKIKNMTNFKSINEMIFNTYNNNKNNYYNAININNILLSYSKNNEYIKNKILLKTKNYEEILKKMKMVKTKSEDDLKYKERKEKIEEQKLKMEIMSFNYNKK